MVPMTSKARLAAKCQWRYNGTGRRRRTRRREAHYGGGGSLRLGFQGHIWTWRFDLTATEMAS